MERKTPPPSRTRRTRQVLPPDPALIKRQHAINEFLEEKSKNNAIKLLPAETRNIIFLGRTRSGKSTALKMLKDPFGFSEGLSLFSQTKEPALYPFTVCYTNEDGQQINYNINIMDTPGLFERAADSKQRNNDMIKSTISKCLEFEITKLHTLFFVCSFEAGINQQDIESILEMNQLFKGADKAFSLLVSHCEKKDSDMQADLEEQIRRIPELREFFDNEHVQIFFSGSLDKDDFTSGVEQSVHNNLTNILALRKELYDHIFVATEPCHITKLDIFAEQKKSAEQLQDQVESLSKQLNEYQGTEEARKELQAKLQQRTDQLKAIAGQLSRVTGQIEKDNIEEVLKEADSLLKLRK